VWNLQREAKSLWVKVDGTYDVDQRRSCKIMEQYWHQSARVIIVDARHSLVRVIRNKFIVITNHYQHRTNVRMDLEGRRSQMDP
jgi:hypothetical protein